MEQAGGGDCDVGLYYLPDGRLLINGALYEPPEPGALDLYCKNVILHRVKDMTNDEDHSRLADPPLVFQIMYEYAEEEEDTPEWFRPFCGLAPLDGPEPYKIRLAAAKINFYRVYHESYLKYIEEKSKETTPIIAAASLVKNQYTPIVAAGSSVKSKLATAYGMLKNASKVEWAIGLGIGLTAGAAFSYILFKK